jgi:hypothetical protein
MSEKIVITQHSVPELIPTPAASRLIGSGYAPLQHTQSACLWALGLTSAPLGLSRHMAGQRARALSWLTRHSALHRRAQRLLPGSAIVTTLNRPGFAHHTLPLWRALCSSSRRRHVGVCRRHAAPFPAHHTSWRSDPLAVSWPPVLIWPARLLPTRPGGGGVAEYMRSCVILGRLHRASRGPCHMGPVSPGTRARPAPRAKERPRAQRGERSEAGARRATLSGAAAAATRRGSAELRPPEAAVQHSVAARAR